MTRIAAFPTGAILSLFCASAWAQPVSVTYQHGLVSINCSNAPIASVFESIETMTGIELILEDEVKSKRVTASLTEIPLSMAIQRLLEGTGVNYVVMMDPSNWGRVDKVFVGAGGGGPARSAPAPAYEAPEPMDQPEEAYEEPMDSGDMGEMPDPGVEAPPEDFGNQFDSGEFNPPGSSPIPDFLPPAQSFPRSNFTPGLPSGTQRSPSGTTQQKEQNPNNPPPATFPFTDPFGRPIPIPPGMNEQQDGQPPRRQQQQQ